MLSYLFAIRSGCKSKQWLKLTWVHIPAVELFFFPLFFSFFFLFFFFTVERFFSWHMNAVEKKFNSTHYICTELSFIQSLQIVYVDMYQHEESYSQLAVGEALWSLALISLSEKQKTLLSKWNYCCNLWLLCQVKVNIVSVLYMNYPFMYTVSELSVYLCSELSLWWQDSKLQSWCLKEN